MIYYSKEQGIFPGEDISKKLNELLASFSGSEDEKELVFEPGDYYLDIDNLESHKLFITNTIGEKEYNPDEEKYIHKVGFFIDGVKNLTISGVGARFIARGRMTNMAVLNSENITVKDIEFLAENPDLHEFTVKKSSAFSTVFELDSESSYIKENGKFYFTGHGYKTPFTLSKYVWPCFGHYFAEDEKRIKRAAHPFMGARGIKEIAPHTFKVSYLLPKKFTVGDMYSVYDVRRLDVGFFVENTKNIALKGIKQRFNVSLAFVAQNTENIDIDSVEFCPADGQVKRFASYADFVQVCMCKGQVNVTNSTFIGAGDDVLNVHGTHFKITSVNGNTIKCKFMHPQSHGYLAFNPGDKIEFVNPSTLACVGEATVKTAKLDDYYTVSLEVDDAKDAKPGNVIENVTLCPDLYFANNYMSNIVTRGLLITTRGKVVVENNTFANTIMPSLLFSDDAKSWYESGPCKDVTIRGNSFEECDECYIRILPENGSNKNIVHGDFLVEGNTFKHNRGIEAKNTKSLILKDNIYLEKENNFVKANNVETVKKSP